jgi:hypothetical protein
MLHNHGCIVELPEGAMVMHTCDTPMCINPAHLVLGDCLKNMQDASAKERMERGEDRWCAKLTPDRVREIRILHEARVPRAEVAARFGVSESLVKKIWAGTAWRWVA